MNKLLVTRSQARRLKSLGFRDLCYYNYDACGNLCPNSMTMEPGESITTYDIEESHNSGREGRVDAPFLWQAQRWLIEKDVIIETRYYGGGLWKYTIKTEGYDKKIYYGQEEYQSLEEALSEGISMSLNIIDQNENAVQDSDMA